MQVPMSRAMIQAIRETPEVPANLLACVENAEKADGDEFLVTLSADERMAMEEMCQWYVQKDPDTGELSKKGELFNSIVDVLYETDEA